MAIETSWSNKKVMESPRFFPRQLVTPEELTLEQEYFRQKMQRHNRMLHGWGVVCGADVCRLPSDEDPEQPDPWMVKVKPGYILDPYGNEIYIDVAHTLDIRRFNLGAGDPKGHSSDPWCSDVVVDLPEGPVYLAVRYYTKKTRPVPVPPTGCGSSDHCEYSRWLDCYEFGVLTECPESHQNPPEMNRIGQGPIPECPPNPTDPWVVLACIDLTQDGIVSIDNCACRRLVIGFGSIWWQCSTTDETRADLRREEVMTRLRVLMLDSALAEVERVEAVEEVAAAAIANTPAVVRSAVTDMSIADVANLEHEKLMLVLQEKSESITDEHRPAIVELQARARMVLETSRRLAK